MANFKISAKAIIERARDMCEYDWQGACAMLADTLGCPLTGTFQFFISTTLMDGPMEESGTREMVVAAYEAHKAVILAPWRQSWDAFVGVKGQRQMVKDLERLVEACQPFVPSEWYDRVQLKISMAAHDVKFDGAQAGALEDVECGIIEVCHDFLKEAAQTLGILEEMVNKYEVRA